MNNIIHQLDLLQTSVEHVTPTEYTLFSSANGIIEARPSARLQNMPENILHTKYVPSHSGMQLQINNRRTLGSSQVCGN